MTRDEHRARHQALHEALGELVADFVEHTGKLPSEATCMHLMEWSYRQTTDPDEGLIAWRLHRNRGTAGKEA